VHAGVETNPAQPAPSTSATGPAPRHETDEGWKKVERKRKGKGKEKKGVERKEGSVPSWADKARAVYVTVIIGGNRDARPGTQT